MKLKDILSIRRPYGGPGETYLLARIREITRGKQDDIGNVTARIGKRPKVCFVAHADTVDREEGTKPVHCHGGLVYTSPREACLGADDGAGVYALLQLWERRIPALYVWTTGEEVGAIGAREIRLPASIKAVISLDRRGTSDIITHQSGRQCASDAAATFLASHIPGYKQSKLGSFTDSKVFADTVPECLNLSCGYHDEHSSGETLDVRHLRALIDALATTPWADMPIERVPAPEPIPAFPVGKASIPQGWTPRALDWNDYSPDGVSDPDSWARFDSLCRSDS